MSEDMVAMSNVDNPRKELQLLICQQIHEALVDRGVVLLSDQVMSAADGVMRLFNHVHDDWSRIDISTLGQGRGSNYLWQRDIVATVVGRPAVVAKRIE